MSVEKRAYTINEVAEAYSVSRSTVYNWIRRGLTTLKIGKSIRIAQADLDAFDDAHRKFAVLQ
ncbi:helix-turn-helix domain-containing protein [Corynebacterium pyruviciproducens]|uniref:helix-turn-helix domain-containing protein n=1 Tax=Corynebacterium pyruviciproducens TaxID=598660 RepID=UPI0025512CFA|nr:helix-turn-helix domain-containing protein [Corynebacterium pyruviciproducens]MDK6565865.1 helix-turn-helix domain-containing protein [Corynebacterium pyruviciproducens]